MFRLVQSPHFLMHGSDCVGGTVCSMVLLVINREVMANVGVLVGVITVDGFVCFTWLPGRRISRYSHSIKLNASSVT